MLSHASGRSEVELGQAAMIGGLLLLAFSNSSMNSYIAGILLGMGTGTTVSRFLYKNDQPAEALRAGNGKQYLSADVGGRSTDWFPV